MKSRDSIFFLPGVLTCKYPYKKYFFSQKWRVNGQHSYFKRFLLDTQN